MLRTSLLTHHIMTRSGYYAISWLSITFSSPWELAWSGNGQTCNNNMCRNFHRHYSSVKILLNILKWILIMACDHPDCPWTNSVDERSPNMSRTVEWSSGRAVRRYVIDGLTYTTDHSFQFNIQGIVLSAFDECSMATVTLWSESHVRFAQFVLTQFYNAVPLIHISSSPESSIWPTVIQACTVLTVMILVVVDNCTCVV